VYDVEHIPLVLFLEGIWGGGRHKYLRFNTVSLFRCLVVVVTTADRYEMRLVEYCTPIKKSDNKKNEVERKDANRRIGAVDTKIQTQPFTIGRIGAIEKKKKNQREG
jgi:hypothetical protein